jgi:hypothetical protein
MDLLMLASFGAKEKTELDWEYLFEQTDQRLGIVRMHYEPRGAGLGSLEIDLRACWHAQKAYPAWEYIIWPILTEDAISFHTFIGAAWSRVVSPLA